MLGLRSLKPYVPDFSTAFQHFCIHPGGKAVIEEARRTLTLARTQARVAWKRC